MNRKLLGLGLLVGLLIGCTGTSAEPPTEPAPTETPTEVPPTPTPEPTPTATPVPTPTFAAARYGSAEIDVEYCAINPDMPQAMDIYFPSSGGPWPGVVYIHGGSWMNGDKSEGEGWRALNDHGMLVVSVNYRMVAQGKFPVMIEDVKCAVRYLRAHSDDLNLDPERIAVIGASAGGHLASLLGAAGPETGWEVGDYLDESSAVSAVVSMAGPADFSLEMAKPIRMPVYQTFGNLPGSDDEEMLNGGVVPHVDGSEPPYLLFHSDNDGIVLLAQSESLHKHLTEAGVDSQLVVVVGGSHSLSAEGASPTPEERWEMTVAFLRQHLGLDGT